MRVAEKPPETAAKRGGEPAERLEVGAEAEGERLDRFLRARLPGPSRAALAELLAAGLVRINGRRGQKGTSLHAGDVVEVLAAAAASFTEAEAAPDASVPLCVLYEDAFLIAVDKPAGVPSHPLRAGETGTMAGALLARYPELAGVGYGKLEPGLLHRLDTETSGVLLAARSAEAFERLRELHERGGIDKGYLALCAGRLARTGVQHGYLDASAKRVRVEHDFFVGGKPIETEIVRAEPYAHGALSLVEVRVSFAARHQVRAHLAALGHPIAGDATYGGPALPGLRRHFLHAGSVAFSHPWTGARVTITAPLPSDLRALLDSPLKA